MPQVVVRRGAEAPPVHVVPSALAIHAKVTIVGSVEFDGEVQIDGFVQGDVRCSSLNVTKDGTVTGTIVARYVTVSGGVSGSIFAERLVLKPACDVEGEICYRELALEDGSYFEGKSRPNQRPLEIAPACQETKPPLRS